WKDLADGATVTGKASFEANVQATKRSYDITFFYGEQSQIETLEYGALIATDWTPTLENTDEFEYSFLGWKDLADGATVSGPATFEANVSETTRNYTVTIIVGEENYSAELPYGTPYAAIFAAALEQFEIVEVDGQYKFEDAEYTYTFIGWAEVETLPETVTGNATYTMLFNKEPKTPTGVEALERNAAPVKVYENGVLYILRNGKKYTPAGSFVQ
ncbi:MAG: hypothetical protein J5612_05605, partial [Paludibacteraceae bacterium]|nr:hypothetical protein [Paludibacteraceae bacterium]